MKKQNYFILLGVLVVAFVAILVIMIVRDQKVPTEQTNNNTSSMKNTNSSAYTFPGILPDDQIKNKQVRITTGKGDIVFELFADDAPNTVSNFVYLVSNGFYDGLTFHRVEAGFVIQGGDPRGDGTGGPGYQFDDEPVTRNYDKGIVAMANSGPDTNGSQFFIMLADNTDLPKDYTIFGKVTAGQDIVDAIAVGDVMQTVTIENK